MAVGHTLILQKELLLSINYYESEAYSFYTDSYEFYADSDDTYPECLNLNSEAADT